MVWGRWGAVLVSLRALQQWRVAFLYSFVGMIRTQDLVPGVCFGSVDRCATSHMSGAHGGVWAPHPGSNTTHFKSSPVYHSVGWAGLEPRTSSLESGPVTTELRECPLTRTRWLLVIHQREWVFSRRRGVGDLKAGDRRVRERKTNPVLDGRPGCWLRHSFIFGRRLPVPSAKASPDSGEKEGRALCRVRDRVACIPQGGPHGRPDKGSWQSVSVAYGALFLLTVHLGYCH